MSKIMSKKESIEYTYGKKENSNTSKSTWDTRLLVKIMAIFLTLLFISLPPSFAEQTYRKVYFVNRVDGRASIHAGGEVQTWFGDTIVNDNVTIYTGIMAPVVIPYQHATQRSKRGLAGSGLPILRVRKHVDPKGYSSGLVNIMDGHVNENNASVEISVSPRRRDPQTLDTRTGGRVILSNHVQTILEGKAKAGLPRDGDKRHSADSFAGAQIQGAQIFKLIPMQGIPTLEVFGKDVMSGGAFEGNGIAGKQTDPYFMTITDLKTGEVMEEVVMMLSLEYSNAFYSVDDSGIRLTIDRSDPDSFVSLMFSSEFPWVLNPYTYGATLDADGLTAFGETPLDGWQITTTDDTVEAFFAFGPEGQPFDSAVVDPPDSFFIAKHKYKYDIGSSAGAFEVAVETPTPSPSPTPTPTPIPTPTSTSGP